MSLTHSYNFHFTVTPQKLFTLVLKNSSRFTIIPYHVEDELGFRGQPFERN